MLFASARGAGFGPDEVAQAVLLADFGASAAANAQLFQRVESLLAQARMREAERAELSRRILSAEQDERRKLSLFLHDGPLQAMSGIAMMLDAVAEDTADGSTESALRVLETARERQRSVIRSLRELSFALEPWVLRDQGFVVALRALADEMERGHAVSVELDVDAAGDLPADDQVFLYQIVREAVQNAVKHAAPRSVTVTGDPAAGSSRRARRRHRLRPTTDDGLPHHGMTSMRERAQILGGRLRIDSVPGAGTELRVSLPASERRRWRRPVRRRRALVEACENGLDLPAVMAAACSAVSRSPGVATAAYVLTDDGANLRLVAGEGAGELDPPGARRGRRTRPLLSR